MPTDIGTPSPRSADPTATRQLSAVEGIKDASRQLRGTIVQELAGVTDHFSEPNKQLLKFHGSYQQEDRDARKARRKDGLGKHHMFMIRCKIPGGRLTARQYLAMDDLAGKFANGTLRFTTRQSIQLHGVLKSHLKDTIAGINACLLSTLGACGDVERNVMACPAPHHGDGVHVQLQETALVLAAHLAPRTRAYHEIWLDGKPVDLTPEPAAVMTPLPADLEPLYGKVYLPRKFKTGLALPEDNCIDVYAQDLGLLAIVDNGEIVGYNVLVGGGMGMTNGSAETFPHLARPICYVPASAVVGAAEAVVKLFRDHGNRANRKRARIKYLVHDWGVDKFRDVLAGYLGGAPTQPRALQVSGFEPHLGWHAQGDGKWYYGLSIENGRIKDEGALRLRSGLRTIIERFQPDMRLTALQDILLCGLDAGARQEIERLLAEHGILRPDQISSVQRFSMACPAIPTCGLAITESERALPGLIDQLEVELKRLGLENEKLSVRMTGCPNGCARPYQSDIGLVGRSGDKYTVFVGGSLLGNRLNFLLKDLVPFAELLGTLLPLLEHFKDERRPGESFGDFCHRAGREKLCQWLPQRPEKSSTEGAPSRAIPAGAAPIASASTNPPNRGARTSDRARQAPQLLHVGTARANGSPALAEPETKPVWVALAEPAVAPARVPLPSPVKRSETFLAGRPGEERPDYTFRFNSDTSVRETTVYFYGNDQRATDAHAGDPLRREAVYVGRVDPFRLFAACKLSDTHYVGPTGHERRDVRAEYHPDGRIAQTVVFHYDNDARAIDAPSGSPIRRQVAYEGPTPT